MNKLHESPEFTRLGIGIVTYNRKEALLRSVKRVQECTTLPFSLIVADDGSSDGSHDALRELNVTYVTGANRGIAWNKNRALLYLNVYARCDVIILLEDDTFPNRTGWEAEWIEAVGLWGHVNVSVPWRASHCFAGSGTPKDPFQSNFVSGQVSAFSAEAIGIVGYLDTRFKTYGHEHVEHTSRMLASGFGGVTSPRTFYLLKGAIEFTSQPTHGTPELVMTNTEIAREISKAEIAFGAPWRSSEERQCLKLEMNTALNK